MRTLGRGKTRDCGRVRVHPEATRYEHDNTRYRESYVGILPYAVQRLRTEVQLRESMILSSIPSQCGLRVSRLDLLQV